MKVFCFSLEKKFVYDKLKSQFKGRPLRVTMIPTSRWTACPGDSVSDYPADYRYTCSNTHESPASSHRACLAGCLGFLLKNPENNHNKIVIHDFHWSYQYTYPAMMQIVAQQNFDEIYWKEENSVKFSFFLQSKTCHEISITKVWRTN